MSIRKKIPSSMPYTGPIEHPYKSILPSMLNGFSITK